MIAKKHAQQYMPNGELSLEQVIQAAIDEATDNATLRLVAVNREVVELKEHIRQLDFVIEQHKNHAIGLHERIRQLEAERVPDGWMRDRIQVNDLITHLDGVAYQCGANGDIECINQAAAMSVDVLRLVLLPMLAAAPSQEKV